MRKYGKYSMLLFLAVAVIGILAGCAGKDLKKGSKPDWVARGSGAFKEEAGKILYGVGSVWGVKNPSLVRTTADNRARAEIAKVFKFYTASLMKDYQTSAMAGDADTTTEEQHIEETIKTFVKGELPGVMIVDHWQDPENTEYFSLARMDFQVFETYLKNLQQLSAETLERVLEHSEKAFRDLENEEDRH